MVKAMYAFSGDPITYGHIDIIKRASSVFNKLIVAIGVNPEKEYTFTLKERTDMTRKSLAGISNVKVVSFKGLLVDYAYEHDIPVIIKGLRNSADFDYEYKLHQIGDSQRLGIDTFMLFARPGISHISSSTVKAIQKEQGLIHEYVPLYVKQYLERRLSGQYILGVTGEIGSGKSYVCEKFVQFGKLKGIQVHNIELDHIGHQILSELKEAKYHEIREMLIDAFGDSIKLKDGSISRKELGKIVFNDEKKLKKLNEIIYTPLLVRLKRELYGKKGLILINAALLVEAGMVSLCNNNVVLIKTDAASQKRRLLERDLTCQQIERRLASQYSSKEKERRLKEIIKNETQGVLWVIDNPDNQSENNIKKVFDDAIKNLEIK